jgi:hypothetical protein
VKDFNMFLNLTSSRRGGLLSPLWITALFVFAQLLPAQQVAGRVIDRNGSPQIQCNVDLIYGNRIVASAVTNQQGGFYMNAGQGGYLLRVVQRQRSFTSKVSVDSAGLRPSTIVVNW